MFGLYFVGWCLLYFVLICLLRAFCGFGLLGDLLCLFSGLLACLLPLLFWLWLACVAFLVCRAPAKRASCFVVWNFGLLWVDFAYLSILGFCRFWGFCCLVVLCVYVISGYVFCVLWVVAICLGCVVLAVFVWVFCDCICRLWHVLLGLRTFADCVFCWFGDLRLLAFLRFRFAYVVCCACVRLCYL